MKELIKNIVILGVLLGLGLLAGTGVQRLRAHYQAQAEVAQAGDYSALIAQSEAPVVLFSTATCPYCKLAKGYLAEHGIAYRDIDVRTEAGKALFDQHEGSGVPLLITADMRLQGFVEPEYDKHVLSLAKAAQKG